MKISNILILLALFISCFCYASDDNQQYWAVTSFSFRLNDTWKMKIKEDFRFRNGEHFEQQNEIFFNYTGFSDTLDLGFGFRQIHKEDANHEWQRENRPYFEIRPKWNFYNLKWSNRNRLEYREFESKKDVLRYRNWNAPQKLVHLK